jgi:acylpyruvate hydrolase
MKLYLGLTENSAPHQTRIFGELENKLVDLSLTYAAYLAHTQTHATSAYELAGFYFPDTIAAFLEHGATARRALDELVSFARRRGTQDLRGPTGEKVVYDPGEIRLLPPLRSPGKSIVIGFSDRARTDGRPKAEMPTGFYKLPQTFVTKDAPIIWPRFSEEVDADACLALVIGKAGRRIPPEQGWNHIAGVSLLVDITARDINRREGATANNLLGKNFPSSTSLGPAVLLASAYTELDALEVELSLDGAVKQKFTLRDCVLTAEQIIARWSTLGIGPGDFLAIGASMALRGDRLQDPVALKVGSTIRCASPHIGELTHRIVASAGARK